MLSLINAQNEILEVLKQEFPNVDFDVDNEPDGFVIMQEFSSNKFDKFSKTILLMTRLDKNNFFTFHISFGYISNVTSSFLQFLNDFNSTNLYGVMYVGEDGFLTYRYATTIIRDIVDLQLHISLPFMYLRNRFGQINGLTSFVE